MSNSFTFSYSCASFLYIRFNTNRTELLLQINPIHYRSIRTTTNRSEPLRINPIHYKLIRSTTNRSEQIRTTTKTTNRSDSMNRSDSLQIVTIQYKSYRFNTNRSDALQIDRFTTNRTDSLSIPFSYSYRFLHIM